MLSLVVACIVLLGLVLFLLIGIGAMNAALRASVEIDPPDDD